MQFLTENIRCSPYQTYGKEKCPMVDLHNKPTLKLKVFNAGFNALCTKFNVTVGFNPISLYVHDTEMLSLHDKPMLASMLALMLYQKQTNTDSWFKTLLGSFPHRYKFMIKKHVQCWAYMTNQQCRLQCCLYTLCTTKKKNIKTNTDIRSSVWFNPTSLYIVSNVEFAQQTNTDIKSLQCWLQCWLQCSTYKSKKLLPVLFVW